MSHTPGPWFRIQSCLAGQTGPWAFWNPITEQHVITVPHPVASEDDARLIAAAPDLLSIAKRWVAMDEAGWTVHRWHEKDELIADTRAAIAKAGNP